MAREGRGAELKRDVGFLYVPERSYTIGRASVDEPDLSVLGDDALVTNVFSGLSGLAERRALDFRSKVPRRQRGGDVC